MLPSAQLARRLSGCALLPLLLLLLLQWLRASVPGQLRKLRQPEPLEVEVNSDEHIFSFIFAGIGLKGDDAKLPPHLVAHRHLAFHLGKRVERVRALRRMPDWQAKQAEWQRWVNATGLDFGPQRYCDTASDWIGTLTPLLVPRLKLAFCHVAKAGCTSFKDLFNTMNGFESARGPIEGYLDSSARELNISMDREVTKENGWTFATFTRDPLERYFSAFGSTCLTDEGIHPFACCGGMSGRKVSLEDLAERFGRRAAFDARLGLPFLEQHWSPQVRILANCGWDKFGSEAVDFHGHISAGNVNGQVKKMLRLANASEGDLRLVDEFFPQKGPTLNTNPIRMDPAAFYDSLEVVDAVRTAYRADYASIPGIGEHFTDRMLERFHPRASQ